MNIGEKRPGTRVRGKKPHELQEGEYMLGADAAVEFHDPDFDHSLWMLPPGARHYMRVSSKIHGVEVHSMDSITVTPSIVCLHGDGSSCWHGFLQAGIWSRVP